MKSIRIVHVVMGLLVAALFGTSAYAQGWLKSSQELGFYAGGGVAHATMNDFCDGAAFLAVGCDEKDVSWKVTAGYQFHPNVGVEVSFVDLGKYTASLGAVSGSVRVRALELVGLGIIPLAQRFSLFAKAGFYRWDADTAIAFVGSGNDKGTDFTFGVGAQYAFNPNLAARAEWQRYAGDVDVDTLGVSLLYYFR